MIPVSKIRRIIITIDVYEVRKLVYDSVNQTWKDIIEWQIIPRGYFEMRNPNDTQNYAIGSIVTANSILEEGIIKTEDGNYDVYQVLLQIVENINNRFNAIKP